MRKSIHIVGIHTYPDEEIVFRATHTYTIYKIGTCRLGRYPFVDFSRYLERKEKKKKRKETSGCAVLYCTVLCCAGALEWVGE